METLKVSKANNRFNCKRVHATSSSSLAKFISLEYVGDWPMDKCEITIHDKFILRSQEYFHLYVCPTPDCDYNSNRRDNWEAHLKRCTNEIDVTFKQKLMNEENVRSWCVRNDLIDGNYYQRDFATFDIETLGGPRNEQVTASTLIHDVQKVVTISVTNSLDDESNQTRVFVRKSFSKDDYETLIREFMSHLESLQLKMVSRMPRKVLSSIVKLEASLDEFKQGQRNYSPLQVTNIRRALGYLKKMQILKVYGYNSSGFDIPVLFQGIVLFLSLTF